MDYPHFKKYDKNAQPSPIEEETKDKIVEKAKELLLYTEFSGKIVEGFRTIDIMHSLRQLCEQKQPTVNSTEVEEGNKYENFDGEAAFIETSTPNEMITEEACNCNEWDCDICGKRMSDDCKKNKEFNPVSEWRCPNCGEISANHPEKCNSENMNLIAEAENIYPFLKDTDKVSTIYLHEYNKHQDKLREAHIRARQMSNHSQEGLKEMLIGAHIAGQCFAADNDNPDSEEYATNILLKQNNQ